MSNIFAINIIKFVIGNGYFKPNLNGNNGLRYENESFFREGFVHKSLDRGIFQEASSPRFWPYCKLILWLSPLLLFFVPAALYYYAESDLLVSIVFGPLLVAIALQEYVYRRGVIKQFRANEPLRNSQAPRE